MVIFSSNPVGGQMRRALYGIRLVTLIVLSGSCAGDQLASIAGAQDGSASHKPATVANSAPTSPARAPAAQSVTREQLVVLMLDPSIRESTPEQTAIRLSPLGELTRSSMFPDQLDLRGESSAQRVLVEYVQGKDGFQFSHLRVALWSAPGAELKAAYDAIDAQLAAALGKPRWIKKVPDALPNRAYRVGKKLLIVLGEGLEKGKSFVRLELGEPQGERG